MRTHLPSDSPQAARHHTNWRLKAVENLDRLSSKELAFTSPTTLSENDAQKLRKKILEFIEDLNPLIEPSPCEQFYCLNIDWFEVK